MTSVRFVRLTADCMRFTADCMRLDCFLSFQGDSSFAGEDLLGQRIKWLQDELVEERNAQGKNLAQEGVASRGRAGV